jgi:hypothetical protein
MYPLLLSIRCQQVIMKALSLLTAVILLAIVTGTLKTRVLEYRYHLSCVSERMMLCAGKDGDGNFVHAVDPLVFFSFASKWVEG